MASYYDLIDAAWSWNGDILLSHDKDIKDTRDDTLKSLVDQITMICSSEIGDWLIYPGRAAALDEFIGEANNRRLANRIHDRIRISLVSAGIVAERDLKVKIVPVQLHKIMVVIYIDALSYPTNSLAPGEPLKAALVYDTSQRQVFYVAPKVN